MEVDLMETIYRQVAIFYARRVFLNTRRQLKESK